MNNCCSSPFFMALTDIKIHLKIAGASPGKSLKEIKSSKKSSKNDEK